MIDRKLLYSHARDRDRHAWLVVGLQISTEEYLRRRRIIDDTIKANVSEMEPTRW